MEGLCWEGRWDGRIVLGGTLGRKGCAGRDLGWDVRNWEKRWVITVGGRWENGKSGTILGVMAARG